MSTEPVDAAEEGLTAYALGELDDAARAQVEAQLASDPAAKRQVDEVRAVARLLTAELATERATGLATDQRAAVEGRLAYVERGPSTGALTAKGIQRRWVVRGVAIAASIAIAGGTTALL